MWTPEKARDWYASKSWPVGCNYFPATAVNPIEMWRAETFDPGTIDSELAWAATLGFNSLRTNLHYLVWESDPAGQRARLDVFLELAVAHGMTAMVNFFDDCAHSGQQPVYGPQQDPVPGVHNSRWTPSPGHAIVRDKTKWAGPERFVTEIIRAFATDTRILCWDLYNEPGNGGLEEESLPFLDATFAWARAANPAQPLTTGVWNDAFKKLNEKSLALSDIVTFHNYNGIDAVTKQVERLKKTGRPLLCTEWLARGRGSTVKEILPYFKRERVGAYNWGLVNGRTQTHFPWNAPAGGPEPDPWHHDLLKRDGTPYRPEELLELKRIIKS